MGEKNAVDIKVQDEYCNLCLEEKLIRLSYNNLNVI